MTEYQYFRRVCDFCGIATDSDQMKDKIIISAPHGDICEDCVAVCQEVIEEQRREAAKAKERDHQ